jgi:hypothetical protein
MNERIKELAKQASIDVRHIEKHADEEFSDQLEKFAELIVKECAATALALQQWPASEPHHCASDILIHFGLST